MKKTILTLAILASMSLSATTFAQDNKCNILKMGKELKVSDEQKESIKALKADFEQQKKAIKMSRITEEMQKVKIEALRKEHKEKVMGLLTPEQLTKFNDKMQLKEGKKGKHAKRNKKNLGGQVWALAGIELSDQQQKQYKELSENYAKQRADLDQKQKEEVRKLLTPEQQATFDTNSTRNSFKGDYGKLDAASRTKIKELKKAHKKEVEAVKRSRIAPEMQETKIKILKENLVKEIKEVVDTAAK